MLCLSRQFSTVRVRKRLRQCTQCALCCGDCQVAGQEQSAAEGEGVPSPCESAWRLSPWRAHDLVTFASFCDGQDSSATMRVHRGHLWLAPFVSDKQKAGLCAFHGWSVFMAFIPWAQQAPACQTCGSGTWQEEIHTCCADRSQAQWHSRHHVHRLQMATFATVCAIFGEHEVQRRCQPSLGRAELVLWRHNWQQRLSFLAEIGHLFKAHRVQQGP